MQKEIKQTWHFNQSPQEVWEYLTRPELIEQWLMKTDFQPIVGHKFRFIGGCNDEGNTAAYCEVLEVRPFTKLSYSWNGNTKDSSTALTEYPSSTLITGVNLSSSATRLRGMAARTWRARGRCRAAVVGDGRAEVSN